MFRLAYRNFGTHESLVTNHTVNVATNPAFRAGVRYYEIRRTTPPGPWLVHEQGTMAGGAGDTEHRWMGSTALNGAGSQAVGYSVSSLTVFPSIRYAGRLSSDPPGSLAQGEALLVAGTSSQTFSGGHWGTSSNLTVDPVDDCTFWYTQQYVTGASAPDGPRWHTRVGAFQFGTCAPVQKGILTGTVTSTLGGAAIANATVAVGAFTRNSNASGVYTIDPMMTGTHTVTVSAPGFVTSTFPGVTITQGNTTTRNLAITPLNFLTAGTPVIAAEGCGGGNNALDPGETVTVNLPISNNGGAGSTTTNLVGDPAGGGRRDVPVRTAELRRGRAGLAGRRAAVYVHGQRRVRRFRGDHAAAAGRRHRFRHHRLQPSHGSTRSASALRRIRAATSRRRFRT